MARFGSFLNGLVEGMDRRRNWMLADEQMEWARQDREWRAEDRQIAAEDRRLSLEDRGRRIAREDANFEWQQGRRSEALRLEAEERERAATERRLLEGIATSSPATVAPASPEPIATPAPRTVSLPGAEPRPTVGAPTHTRLPAQETRPSEADPPGPLPAPGRQINPRARTLNQDPRDGEVSEPSGDMELESYVARADALGVTDTRIRQFAAAGDIAARGLREDVHPRTRQPLDDSARAELQHIVDEAEQALATISSEPNRSAETQGLLPAGQPRQIELPSEPDLPLGPETPPSNPLGLSNDARPPSVQDVAEPLSQGQAEEAMRTAMVAASVVPSTQIAEEVASEALAGRTIRMDPSGRNIQYLDETTIAQVGNQFVHAYNSDAVRELEQFYIREGNVEQAQRWRQFIAAEDTQTAIYHFGRALTAARVGDAERFLGEMAAIYNAPQYYDDGYTVDLARSQIFRDDRGGFTGVSVAFVNDDTGEVFMRDIDSEDELYSMALGLAAPETVFQNWYASYEASVAAREEAARAWEEANAPPSMAERREDFDEVYQYFYEAAGDPLLSVEAEGVPANFRNMPRSEQAQAVLDYIAFRENAITGRMMPSPRAVGETPIAVSP